MSHNGHDAYLESRVLSADPLELVRILYEAAGSSIRQARQSLAEGDIAGRSRAISKSYDILAELLGSLDRESGGEIAVRLALLYDYMQRRLLDANLQQADGPLAEVLGLLSTLADAWEGARPAPAPAAPVANPWGGIPVVEAEPVAHAWSV